MASAPVTLVVTGGAGFVGSHTTLELLNSGYRVIVIDNLCNSYLEALKRVAFLAFGNASLEAEVVKERLIFYETDLTDLPALRKVFERHSGEILGVLHFAGLKSVSRSVSNPRDFFNSNVVGSWNLFHCMLAHNITNIIFSSSASVYGSPERVPIPETEVLKPISPYGETKIIIEKHLRTLGTTGKISSVIIPHDVRRIAATLSALSPLPQVACSRPTKLADNYPKYNEENQDNDENEYLDEDDEDNEDNNAGGGGNAPVWSVVILRYFNPCGAHPSGMLGEFPKDTKDSNLMPALARVAMGEVPSLKVFQSVSTTDDGTPIRDYIHVVDLAKGHVAALSKFSTREVHTFNLGMGAGSSVLEVIKAFREVSKRDIPLVFSSPRPGDPPILISNVDKITEELSWSAKRDMKDICTDFWRWVESPGGGYGNT